MWQDNSISQLPQEPEMHLVMSLEFVYVQFPHAVSNLIFIYVVGLYSHNPFPLILED